MNLISTPLGTFSSESSLDRFRRISNNGPKTYSEADVKKE